MEGLEAVHNTKEKEINSVVVESYFYVISLVVLERTNIDYFVVEEEELKHSEYCYFCSSIVSDFHYYLLFLVELIAFISAHELAIQYQFCSEFDIFTVIIYDTLLIHSHYL